MLTAKGYVKRGYRISSGVQSCKGAEVAGVVERSCLIKRWISDNEIF